MATNTNFICLAFPFFFAFYVSSNEGFTRKPNWQSLPYTFYHISQQSDIFSMLFQVVTLTNLH